MNRGGRGKDANLLLQGNPFTRWAEYLVGAMCQAAAGFSLGEPDRVETFHWEEG